MHVGWLLGLVWSVSGARRTIQIHISGTWIRIWAWKLTIITLVGSLTHVRRHRSIILRFILPDGVWFDSLRHEIFELLLTRLHRLRNLRRGLLKFAFFIFLWLNCCLVLAWPARSCSRSLALFLIFHFQIFTNNFYLFLWLGIVFHILEERMLQNSWHCGPLFCSHSQDHFYQFYFLFFKPIWKYNRLLHFGDHILAGLPSEWCWSLNEFKKEDS